MSLSPPTPERLVEDELRPFPVFDVNEIEPHPPTFRQTETHSAFIVHMRDLPLKPSTLEDPRHVMTALFGPVGQDFLDGIGEVSTEGYKFNLETDWSEVIYHVCQILSTNPRHFFNKLETPDEYQGAPCSRDYKCELDYLKECDKLIDRPLDIIKPLLTASGSFVLRRRTEWSAALIKIIHLVVDIFRSEMRSVLGKKATAMARFKKHMQDIHTYMNPRHTLSRFIVGDVFAVDMIIYETLLHLAMPEIHMSNLTGTLNLLWLAEYHSVRCAYDASSATTLYVCLMNPSYFVDVWGPYMRMNFPRIFKHDEETSSADVNAYYTASPPVTWQHLVFYLPDPRQNVKDDPSTFISFLNLGFFAEMLTPEFLSSFKSISAPPEYEELWKGHEAAFTPRGEQTIALRRSKRSTAPPLGHFSEKRKRHQ